MALLKKVLFRVMKNRYFFFSNRLLFCWEQIKNNYPVITEGFEILNCSHEQILSYQRNLRILKNQNWERELAHYYTNSHIKDLQSERNNLKQELENVLALDNAFYSNKLFNNEKLQNFEQTSIATQTEYPYGHYISHVEVIPIYDYASIKKNRNLLHKEFKTVFKFFKRLIQLRYETPSGCSCFEINYFFDKLFK